MELEEELRRKIAQIQPLDERAMALAKKRWDSIAHPLHSLGLLEDAIVTIAGAQGSHQVELNKRCVTPFCANNGVVAQGVTQSGQDVTTIVTKNFCSGEASVCVMARVAGADVIPVDIGVAQDVTEPGLRVHKIAYGTADITQGPAMTREQAADAILYGMNLVKELKEEGYRLIATGEMGIGNTTTSSALAAVLLDRPVEDMTGRGAGLSSEGLQRKIRAIETAIQVNQPDPGDVLDVLHKVGGLDIAGLAGVFLGGALCHTPVLVDGFISSVAALVAARLCPDCRDYMLGSHASEEPASQLVLAELGLRPFLYAGMRLGEGTGAVAVMPLLDMGLAVYREMTTFEDTNIEAYQPLV